MELVQPLTHSISTPPFHFCVKIKEMSSVPTQQSNLELLTQALELAPSLTSEFLFSQLKQYSVSKSELAPFIQFNPKHYVRTSILREPRFEILCLCWLPGQFSPIHDHWSSVSTISIISGTATEHLYQYEQDGAVENEIRKLEAGFTYGEEALIHKFGNADDSPSPLITLHVYAPPLAQAKEGDYPGGRILNEIKKN